MLGRDWGTALRKMEERDHERADQEAQDAWREFVREYRRGSFDVEVKIRRKTLIFADKDAIDRFIRR